jgi:hypothetical protein
MQGRAEAEGNTAQMPSTDAGVEIEDSLTLYREAANELLRAGVPFLVGGAFALGHYTPVARNTKDLDLFVRPEHVRWALDVLAVAGFKTELPFPHWLGKAKRGGGFVDIIFSSGNGVALVDDEWFENAVMAEIMGMELELCPPEEMLWSKAFVFERERFDGADVMHLLRDCGACLDWERLLRRFGRHWRVLYAHLILFGYVFPKERTCIPGWVMKGLTDRLERELSSAEPPPDAHVCQGTLLSREQYLVDVEQLGYEDGRLTNADVNMTPDDVDRWTAAIPGRDRSNGRANHRRHW